MNITPHVRAILDVARHCGFVLGRPGSVLWDTLAELWAEGVLEWTTGRKESETEIACFRLTEEGDRMAAVVLAS